MTVKEFVDTYTAVQSDSIKQKHLDNMINNCYIPIRDKMGHFDSIMKGLLQTGQSGASSISIYLYCSMKLIELYTKLEIEDETNDYDLLCATGLMKQMTALLPEDAEEFMTLFQMQYTDHARDDNTSDFYIQRR